MEKALVTHLPEPTTELLMKLCTGCYEPTNGSPSSAHSRAEEELARELRLRAARMPSLRVSGLHSHRRGPIGLRPRLPATLLELLLREWDALAGGRRQGSKAGVAQGHGRRRADVDDGRGCEQQPRRGLSSQQRGGRVGGSAPVGESEGAGAESPVEGVRSAALKAKEEEVMNLLRSKRVPYDKYHALVLVEECPTRAGQLYLYERLARGDSSNNELGGSKPHAPCWSTTLSAQTCPQCFGCVRREWTSGPRCSNTSSSRRRPASRRLTWMMTTLTSAGAICRRHGRARRTGGCAPAFTGAPHRVKKRLD